MGAKEWSTDILNFENKENNIILKFTHLDSSTMLQNCYRYLKANIITRAFSEYHTSDITNEQIQL